MLCYRIYIKVVIEYILELCHRAYNKVVSSVYQSCVIQKYCVVSKLYSIVVKLSIVEKQIVNLIYLSTGNIRKGCHAVMTGKKGTLSI